MRATARFLLLASTSLVVAALAAALLPVSGSAGAKAFSGNLCATASKGALSALKISGPCHQSRSTKVRATPFGSVRVTTYTAAWGPHGSISAPTSHVSFAVIHVDGAAAALAFYAKSFRTEVLANGIPVKMNPLTTEAGDTVTCHNPPIDDCTRAEMMALVGHYGVIGVYYGPAKFVAVDDPQEPSVDEKNDRAQEDQVKAAVVALVNSITAAL
jgi:hypothetical protein